MVAGTLLREIKLAGQDQPFVCEKTLRLLPEKREVILGYWFGKPAVAKLFFDKTKAAQHQERECHGHQLLKKAGIAVPDLLYHGDLNQHKVFVNVYRYVEAKQDARLTWNHDDAAVRLTFLKQIIDIILKQHQSGLYQGDLHPNNFIITSVGVVTLDFAEVHDLWRHKNEYLNLPYAVQHLSALFSQLAIPYRGVIKEGIAYYENKRGEQFSPAERLEIEVDSLTACLKRGDKYQEKLMRNCTRIVFQATFNRLTAVWREAYSPRMRDLFNQIDRVVNQGEVIKAGNSNTVVKVMIDRKTLVIKRYNMKNWIQQLKRRMKTNRARKSWLNAGRLFFHHLPTPLPIALIEHKWGPFRGKVYYVSEYVEGVTLQQFFKQKNLTMQVIDRVVENIKCIFNGLKCLKMSHGDLKASNFLVTEDKVFLTDCDVMQQHKSLISFQRAFKDDVARFMRNWDNDESLYAIFSMALKEFLS